MTSTDQARFLVFPTAADMSVAAAAAIVSLINQTVAETGLFALALSGGSTPQRLYRHLAESYARHLPWEQIHLFWGDERCVPPMHPDSNFRMAFDALISSVRIPYENVHRISGENVTNPEKAAAAAAAYEHALLRFAHDYGRGPALSFDLLLLGMGEDGHTASLFPGSIALAETRHWVTAVEAPASYSVRNRITLTLPLINQAQRVFLLATGAAKRPLVQMIQQDPDQAAQRYPVARVKPVHPPTWFLDEEAAPLTIAVPHDPI